MTQQRTKYHMRTMNIKEDTYDSGYHMIQIMQLKGKLILKHLFKYFLHYIKELQRTVSQPCNCMRYYSHIQLEAILVRLEQGIQHLQGHHTYYLIHPWTSIKFDLSIWATLHQNTPK